MPGKLDPIGLTREQHDREHIVAAGIADEYMSSWDNDAAAVASQAKRNIYIMAYIVMACGFAGKAESAAKAPARDVCWQGTCV